MQNFDAADVIRAAATSNLGVVSLIVLVLAFLAWRFFQRSEDKVKLIAFAMMFLGAAGFVTAVMLAGSGTSEGAATPTLPEAAAPGPAFSQAPAPSPQADAGGVPNIGGAWHDADGYRYAFVQDGAVFTYQMFMGEQRIGSGAGTISGSQLSYRFADEANGAEGSCEATLAADGRTIGGKCRDGSAEWTFTIQR